MNTKPYIHDLLGVVHDDLVPEVHLYVFKIQQDVLKNRRAKTNMLFRDKSSAGPSVFNFTEHTSWDELSSHQAEAVSLNLASRYGYITTVNHGEGAIKAQVGFNLCFDAISGNRENFDFNHLHQQFLGS